MRLLAFIPAAITITAGLSIACAFLDGVILPRVRARAAHKRRQAIKSNRKPWPAWLAWLHV